MAFQGSDRSEAFAAEALRSAFEGLSEVGACG